MNRNSKARFSEAKSNAQKGNRITEFAVPKTMQGGSLGWRKQVIEIGHAKRRSTRPKVAGGKKVFNKKEE